MKKFKLILLGLLIIIVGLFVLYFLQVRYVDNLKKDSNNLLRYYSSYGVNYFDFVPKEKQDVDNFIEWTERVTEKPRLGFLKYGYNIRYDSISKSSLIYTFGKDKIDNNLEYTPLNNNIENFQGQYIFKETSFFDYLGNIFKQKDIILAKIDAQKFPCESVLSSLSSKRPYISYQLYKENTSLWSNENTSKNLFLRTIRQFSKQYNSDFIENGNKTATIYLEYKHGRIETLCSNTVKQNKLSFIEKKLEEFFRKNDTSYFDYAIFSVSLNFEKDDE